jgi:erythromycin esterase-like protein
LIKYLHQETGAKVILLESGIGELAFADMNRDTLTAEQMTNGLVGVWRTKEFDDLMDYVKSEDLEIAGFDVQRSGGSFAFMLDHVTEQYGLDSLHNHDLELRYGAIAKELSNKKSEYDSLKVKTDILIQDYKGVQEEVSRHISGNPSMELLFVEKTIGNRISFLTYMLQFLKDRDWNAKWAARDLAMADNIQWLVDSVYKDQQVIIVAHNFHIGKYNENEIVMGEVLQAKYEKDMYSIGVFAGSGAFSDNYGVRVEMQPTDTLGLDIKHVIAELDGTATFLEIPDKISSDTSWLDQEIIVNDSFIDLSNGNKMNLSKTFDGLIFLQRVSPAK